ncbi:MAG: hypothetical protein KIT77_10950 [Caldilinea sp.]|nr:hypothetical protein [Caldilinea sp.]
MELSDARYNELMDQAMLDCYGEEEEFSGVFCTLEDELRFPLQASLVGVPVVVHGLDSERSTTHRGIVAVVERDGQRYPANLADLEFVAPDEASAEWLAAFRRWAATY